MPGTTPTVQPDGTKPSLHAQNEPVSPAASGAGGRGGAGRQLEISTAGASHQGAAGGALPSHLSLEIPTPTMDTPPGDLTPRPSTSTSTFPAVTVSKTTSTTPSNASTPTTRSFPPLPTLPPFATLPFPPPSLYPATPHLSANVLTGPSNLAEAGHNAEESWTALVDSYAHSRGGIGLSGGMGMSGIGGAGGGGRGGWSGLGGYLGVNGGAGSNGSNGSGGRSPSFAQGGSGTNSNREESSAMNTSYSSSSSLSTAASEAGEETIKTGKGIYLDSMGGEEGLGADGLKGVMGGGDNVDGVQTGDGSYFPPSSAPGPYEEERRRVVKRFGLDGQGRRDAIDRCAAVAQAHFRTPTVIISLVLNDRQILASEIGWDGSSPHAHHPHPAANANTSTPQAPKQAIYSPLRELPLDHDVMRRLDSDCYVAEDVQDARSDWSSFRQNPYAHEGGSITFFASAAIHLPTAFPELPPSIEAVLAVPKPPPTLPVGSICIIDRKPRSKEGFSEEDRMVLKSIADMIAREFQLGFEQQRRETEARQTLFLGEFLRGALVHPSRADKPLASDHHLKPHPPTAPSVAPTPSIKDSSPPVGSDDVIPAPLVFQAAATQLQHLTAADTAVILDLRAFHAPFPPARLSSLAASLATPLTTTITTASSPSSPTTSNSVSLHPPPQLSSHASNSTGEGFTGEASRWGATFSGVAAGMGQITVMGSEGDHDWIKSVASPGCAAAVSHGLVAFYSDGIAEFDSGTIPSPLSDLLPKGTEASLSIPVFDHDGRPSLLLLLCSYVKYFRFEITDRAFVENVGAVCVGSLMRRRILEADRAKLAFVSQISHELRTPLHGIGSQIELIREVSAPATLKKLKPLLDVADVCIASLREVLDDTLEFAKISNTTDAESESPSRARTLTAVDLEQLVEQVAKSSWTRTHQHMSVSADSDGAVPLGTTGAGAAVQIIIEMDERLDGWRALVDVGGLKRVLLNLLGNALKFTTTGSIKIMVYELVSTVLPPEAGVHMIGFAVQDSGMGMSLEFVRDSLFLPFRQFSAFSSGAGLGVSICDSIIRRMHGTLHFESTLGVGTTARIALPLKLVYTSPPHSTLSPTVVPFFPLHPMGPARVRIISDELSSLFDPQHIIDEAAFAADEVVAADARTRTAARLEHSESASHSPIIELQAGPLVDFIPLMANGKGTRVKALVVDDNSISRRILTTLLGAKGVPFVEAENGEVAVKAYKAFRPNLVWSDVQMPIMDGIEATAQIRAYEAEHSLPAAHIVALTGLSSESRLHKAALESGQFDEWLVKGGPSLKILTAGLVRRQAVLDQLASRAQVAASYQAAATAILSGHFPDSLPDQHNFENLNLHDADTEV